MPIPARTGRRPKSLWTAWPFWQMNAGDSFFIALGDPCARNVSQAWGEFTREHPGTRFTMRTLERDPVTQKPGVRVWRTQ